MDQRMAAAPPSILERGERAGTGRIDVEELFVLHHARLVQLAGLLTGSHDAAQDVVADVFVQILRRPPRAVDDPGAYLRRCVVNRVTSRGRRITRRTRLDGTLVAPSGTATDIDGSVTEKDRVIGALVQLPMRQRAVLVLRHFEDLSEAETASVLGVAPGTVKSAGARGAARLRELLSEDEP
jgi:RNA polymerase sigma-70 factor (sigma-E family)